MQISLTFCKLLLIFIFLRASVADLDRVKAYDIYVEANDLYSAGDLDGAMAMYNKALEFDSTHSDSLTNLGSVYQDMAWQHAQAGRGNIATNYLERAIDAYQKAVDSNPYHAMAHFNLALILHDERPEEAIEHYLSAIEADPTMSDAFSNLGAAYHEMGLYNLAVSYYIEAIDLFEDENIDESSPEGLSFLERKTEYLSVLHYRCGEALSQLPDSSCMNEEEGENSCTELAIQHLRISLEFDPDNEVIRHKLAALLQEDLDKSSNAYIAQLFDDFAMTFDESLEELQYSSPQAIHEAVIAIKDEFNVCVDIGCGTGLLGKLLRNCCKTLIGADLSANMIERARALNLYDSLEISDFVDTLSKMTDKVDLIAASDVFVYAGDLAPVFSACADSLQPDGLLSFTLEHLDSSKSCETDQCAGWKLERSGRFSHSRMYVEGAAQSVGLTVKSYKEHFPRLEGGTEILGHLFVLQKKM